MIRLAGGKSNVLHAQNYAAFSLFSFKHSLKRLN